MSEIRGQKSAAYVETTASQGGQVSEGGGQLFGQLWDLLVFVFLNEDSQYVHQ
jgi:hypothetical protein